MTWHNLPCPPTIPALLTACPHGFAELTVAHHAGNPTADPPQEADTSVEIDRLWGVDMPDIGLIEGLATAIVGGEVDMPRVDCTLLVRVDHGRDVCSECGRAKTDDDKDWRCDSREAYACDGVFVTPIEVSANWGPDGAVVYFEGDGPAKYEQVAPRRDTIVAYLRRRVDRWQKMSAHALGAGMLHVAERFAGATRLTADAILDIESDVDLMPPDGIDTGPNPLGPTPKHMETLLSLQGANEAVCVLCGDTVCGPQDQPGGCRKQDQRDRVYHEMLDGKGPDGCGIQKG